jgi:integrase
MLTTTALRTKWHDRDRWLSDGGQRGGGRLVARVAKDGVAFLFQYFVREGDKERKRYLPLGPFDQDGVRGLSLPVARDKAAEFSRIYRSGITDLHAHCAQQRVLQEQATRETEEKARRAVESAQRSSLRQLLEAYVAHLRRSGKQSAKDVNSIFTAHVLRAAPEIASRKATEVSIDDFVRLIGALTEAGKGRTAAKLRSYLRAAYSLAIRSRTDPSISLELRTFGIEVNPLAGVGALAQFSRVRNRTLSGPELAAVLKRLDAVPESVPKQAIQLCVLLGGQRPVQLLRARAIDVDLSAGHIALCDSMGARRQPRRHVVPLTREAGRILERRLKALREGEPLFSSDGRTAMRIETISVLVREIAAEMATAKEIRELFQLRDIRRTCETMLASLGVSSDVRAQLQSHGLGGVQTRHYDRHDYMAEKRQALKTWERHLDRLKTGKTATVVPIRRA